MNTESDRQATARSVVPPVTLTVLTAAGADQIDGWFDDPEVNRRLGGRFWIHRELRLIGERPGTVFRGRTVLRSYGFLVLHRDSPVAFIGGDVYDSWSRHQGGGPEGPVLTDAEPRPCMGFCYVVDPARRRNGYGRAAILALIHHSELDDVTSFFCGIDADNHASRRCVERAGFRLDTPEPDHQDTLYYRRGRPAIPTWRALHDAPR